MFVNIFLGGDNKVNSINERIKLLRSQLNITQEKFGQNINLKRNTISLIEAGERNVTDRVVSDICDKYNVSEYWLRTGEGEMFKKEDSEDLFFMLGLKSDELDEMSKRLVLRYISLSKEQRMAFNEIMGEIFAKN